MAAKPKYCPECGVKLGEEDRFCGGCGEAVGVVEARENVTSTSKVDTSRLRAPSQGASDRKPSDPMRSAFVVVAAVVLVGAALGLGATRLGKPREKDKPSVPVQTNQAASLPRYEYTLNVDLIDLRDRTTVRVTAEDVDGVRNVESRLRSPGEKFAVHVQARGDRVTIRIYYGERLVKTIVQRGDGRTL